MCSGIEGLFGVEGKVALVTGGRRGLGKAMSLALARAGASVVTVAKSADAPTVDSSLAQRMDYLQADLLDRQGRAGLIDQVVQRFGRIDILVNNAGLQEKAPIAEYPQRQWDDDLELMLTAVFDLSRRAAETMAKQGGGKIVHIASVSSFQAARNIVGYTTAKHGLVGLTKAMANEWAPLNINVNAIAPGVFETDMAKGFLEDPKRAAEMKGRIPAGRFGRPEDLVGPLLFLVSEASRHVHGHVLLVDGGWMGR
ncbi:MAG: SDR family oxidoreductase [Myxococcales bacterium]